MAENLFVVVVTLMIASGSPILSSFFVRAMMGITCAMIALNVLMDLIIALPGFLARHVYG